MNNSMMLLLFWGIIVLLTILAMAFFLPWIRSRKLAFIVVVFFSATVYALYFYWGSSSLLGQYYSQESVQTQAKQSELRILMTEFKKEEYRLRLKLAENSADREAEWRLLDLLAIKALLENNKNLARQYWEETLRKAPKNLKEDFRQKLKNLQG